MMTGIRTMRWLLAGVVALGLACDKGGGLSGGGKIEGAASSALDFLPKETGMVFGFSWSSFKDSGVYGVLSPMIPKESADMLKQIKDTCGIDAMADLDSLIVAGGGNLDQSRMLILVKGKWNEDKLNKCAASMGPKLGKNVTTAKDGKITTYTVEGESPMHVGWVGDFMVFTPAAMEGDKTYLSDMLKQKATVKDNAPFMELLKKCDTTATMWGAVLPPADSDMAKGLQQLTGGQEKLAGAWMSVKLTKKLDAAIGIRTGAEGEAKTVADKLNKELEGAKKNPPFGDYLGGTSVSQSGADVNVKVSLSEEQVNKLTDMAKNMLPMMMGQ